MMTLYLFWISATTVSFFFIMPLKSFSKYFLGIKVDQEMQK